MSRRPCKIVARKDVDEQHWLKTRDGLITASEVGAICRVSPFDSPMSVFYSKLGYKKKFDSAAMARGRESEAEIFSIFMTKTGWRGRRCSWLLQSLIHPHIAASPDGFVRNRTGTGLLEIKCSKYYADRDIPEYWYYQIQTQLLVTGLEYAVLVAANPKNLQDNRVRVVFANPELYSRIAAITGKFHECLQRRELSIDFW